MGVTFYRGRFIHHQLARGAGLPTWRKPRNCADARYLAVVWAKRARESRHLTDRYLQRKAEWDYQWNWEKWLPDKWARIGACETGYGVKPGRWDWNSGMFQGAFGFYYGTWDQYKPPGAPSEAYLATPRQQYEAAERVRAVHGYAAWGCGGA